MLKKHLIILLAAFPLLVNGQGHGILENLVATSCTQNAKQVSAKIDEFVRGLKPARPVSDLAFLTKIFHKTHRTFLREYVPYSEFSGIVESGRYDCLTATALYSVVLDELGFQYSIVETNYHIFLLVKTNRGQLLLETTDRFNGLVRNPEEIAQRIGMYRSSSLSDKAQYRYQCEVYNEVSQDRLPGLLYFNQAVKAYNSGNLEKCGELLSAARSIYDTPRIAEFSTLFLKSVVESQLDVASKLRIIRQFKGINPVKSPVLASR